MCWCPCRCGLPSDPACPRRGGAAQRGAAAERGEEHPEERLEPPAGSAAAAAGPHPRGQTAKVGTRTRQRVSDPAGSDVMFSLCTPLLPQERVPGRPLPLLGGSG